MLANRRKRVYIANKPNTLQRFVRHDIKLRESWRRLFSWFGTLDYVADHTNYRDFSFSQNPNITLDFIEEFPNIEWNWEGIMLNENLTIDFVRRHRDKIKDTFILHASCGALALKDVLNIMDRNIGSTDWDCLASPLCNITLEFILKHKLSSHMRCDHVSMNANITMDMVDSCKNPRRIPEPWTKGGLASNPNITIDFIKKYKNIGPPWNWFALSQNPAITMDIVRTNALPWQTPGLSFNPNITIDFIVEHFDIGGWRWDAISQNSNITLRDIETHMHFPWEWDYVSRNPNVTIEFVKANIRQNWDWYELSMNPNITMEDIESNAQLPWKWDAITSNPNLTFEFIQKHRKKLQLAAITSNKFLWDDTVYKRELARDIAVRRGIIAEALPQYLARGICRYIDWA